MRILQRRVMRGVHSYKHRRCHPSVCVKCGTRMRRRTLAAAPEYALKGARWWSEINPGCPPLGDHGAKEFGMGMSKYERAKWRRSQKP